VLNRGSDEDVFSVNWGANRMFFHVNFPYLPNFSPQGQSACCSQAEVDAG
jgi:hypothetical protein